MSQQHRDLIERDRKVTFHASSHLHDFARGEAPGRVITGGKGIHIIDKDGREFIDGFAGLYCVNIGYGRTERSEERRVGKECRSRWWAYPEKTKKRRQRIGL